MSVLSQIMEHLSSELAPYSKFEMCASPDSTTPPGIVSLGDWSKLENVVSVQHVPYMGGRGVVVLQQVVKSADDAVAVQFKYAECLKRMGGYARKSLNVCIWKPEYNVSAILLDSGITNSHYVNASMCTILVHDTYLRQTCDTCGKKWNEGDPLFWWFDSQAKHVAVPDHSTGHYYCDHCWPRVLECECGTIGSPREILEMGDGSWLCMNCRNYRGYQVCSNCGEWEQSTVNVWAEEESQQWCACCAEDLTQCDSCNTLTDVTTSVDDGYALQDWCSNCVDNSATTCAVCDDYISDDRNRCRQCERNTERCDRCGDYVTSVCDVDDESWCDHCLDGNASWCERCECYHGHECCDDSTCVPIHDYNYKPSIFHRLGVGDKLYMGVELEIDDGVPTQFCEKVRDIYETRHQFYLKRDGSLSSHGVEVVTHPATLRYHTTEFPWEHIVASAREANYISYKSGACGLHVHVTRNYFTLCEATKLGLFVYNNVEKFEKLAQRKGVGYAKYKKWKPSPNCVYMEDDRYSAVNYLNPKTIEFRMFKGTLKLSTIFATLELVHATCNFVKVHSTQQILRVDSWGLFEAYVTERKKDYPNLTVYMKRRNV